jgi:hypothetical protein
MNVVTGNLSILMKINASGPGLLTDISAAYGENHNTM